MHILITGAFGMLGRKLVHALTTGSDGPTPTRLTLVDVVLGDAPEVPGIEISARQADMSHPGVAEALIAERPDAIVHLAAMVSGAAEQDFAGGYAANVGGAQNLFEAIRHAGAEAAYCPRVVFASSIAVFGTPLPPVIPDDFICAPQSSYGTQKAICELLLSDYTRHGFIDGMALRLPTLVIRPGKPNAAASGFLSGILREPLAGLRATLPVGDSYRHWFASPRAAVGFVLHALQMDTSDIGPRRALTMPGLSLTVGELIEALRAQAGNEAVALIDRVEDPVIQQIVTRWPEDFDAARAQSLGFRAETSAKELLEVYLEDMAG